MRARWDELAGKPCADHSARPTREGVASLQERTDRRATAGMKVPWVGASEGAPAAVTAVR